jgi:restriction endonuclease S subunit
VSDLPSGWAWAELSQICTSITDGDHQPPPQTSTGIPFLVIGNIRNRRLDFSNCRYVSEEYYQSLKSIRRPQKGDVLYSLVGSYGIPALVRSDDAFCVQRHIGILRPSLEVSASFLAYLLSSTDVYDQATSCATGTAQPTVPLAGLRRIRVPVPPRDEQEKIVAAIEEQFSRLDAGVAALRRAEKSMSVMKTAQLRLLMSAGATLPDGWRRLELGNVISSGPKNGIYLPGNRYGTGVPILRIDDFQNNWQRPRDDLRLVTPDPGQAEEFSLSMGDLVINRVNSMTHLGKCLVVGSAGRTV